MAKNGSAADLPAEQPGTEMAVSSTFGNLPAMPEYLKGSDGKENLSSGEDTTIPRLKIAHEQTKEHVDNGVPVGHFTTNLYGNDLGEEIELVIIQSSPGYLMFDGVGAGGKLISRKFKDDLIPALEPEIVMNPENQKWTKVDIKDPRTQVVTGSRDVKPLASKVYLYICMLNGKIPCALTLGSSALKMARKLNGWILSSDGASYSMVYTVRVHQETGANGTWFIPSFEPKRWATLEEKTEYAKLYAQFKMNKKDVKLDSEDETPGTSEAAKDKANSEI